MMLLSHVYSVLEILDEDIKVGDALLRDPDRVLPHIQAALIAVLEEESFQLADLNQTKPSIFPALTGLPYLPDWSFFWRVPKMDAHRRLIAVSGTVVRVRQSRVMMASSRWVCSRCRSIQRQSADLTIYGQIQRPPVCQAIFEGEKCGNFKFSELPHEDLGMIQGAFLYQIAFGRWILGCSRGTAARID